MKAAQAKAHERLMDIADDLRAVSKEGLSLRAMKFAWNLLEGCLKCHGVCRLGIGCDDDA